MLDQETNIEYDSRIERPNIVEFEPIKPKLNKLLKEQSLVFLQQSRK